MKKTTIPEDFGISPQVRAWAEGQGWAPHLEAHLAYFKDYAASNGAKYADWDAAFRNCVRADWGGVRRQAEMAAKRDPVKQPKGMFEGLFNFGRAK